MVIILYFLEDLNEANIALFLLTATSLTADLQRSLISYSNFETVLISVERCVYLERIKSESGY
jgi:hypothetical protein